MLKGLLLVVLAGLAGIGLGWCRFDSQFGESAFGPFTLDQPAPRGTAVTAAAAPAVDHQGKLPRLQIVGDADFNFGVMEPGSEGKHAFVVRNVGEAPLHLEVTGSTCKCTVGKLQDSALAPGEETNIEMTWVTTGMGEEFGQSAQLKTNDPLLGELNLKIHGRIISRMTMVPRHLSFGEVESGDAIVIESTLFSFSATPIAPVVQKFNAAQIQQRATFEVEEISVASTGNTDYQTATQAFRLKVTVAPGLPQGSITDRFQFGFVPQSAVAADGGFDQDLVTYFDSDFSGRIVGVVTLLENRRVFIGTMGTVFTIGDVDPAAGESFRANLMLRGPRRNELKLLIDRIEPASILRAELGEPVGRSNTVLVPLTLSIAPDAPPTDLMGRGNDDYALIVIKTDDPNLSPLELRVRLNIPAK